MKLLVDTNVLLEIMLEQEKAEEARTFLAKTETHEFFLTDYSLHSLGLLLLRRRQPRVFQQFLRDMVLNGILRGISLAVEDMEGLVEVALRFDLDFDDAYQYTAAEKYALTIVSFDSDFDRTQRGRKTPAEVLQDR